MKKITFKRALALTAWAAAIILMLVACADDLDVKQAYTFDLETMPVPKKLAVETAEIRCTLVREGEYSEVKFFIRIFQYDGAGVLQTDEGLTFAPNDLYPLEKMQFRLYYTSSSSDQANISVFIEDSFGHVIEKSFSFANDTADQTAGDEDELDDNSGEFTIEFPEDLQEWSSESVDGWERADFND